MALDTASLHDLTAAARVPPKVRRRMKNDVDARMVQIVTGAGADLSERDVKQLDRRNMPYYIAELRRAERQTRQLRQRLEALQAGEVRSCRHCGRPVFGRVDAVFCSTDCRVRAHREKAKPASAASGGA